MTTPLILDDCPLAQLSIPTFRGYKGCGIHIFIDPVNCTQGVELAGVVTLDGTNAYNEICCVENFTPTGTSRDEETDEGCLADDKEFTDLGPLKRTPFVVQFRESGVLMANAPALVVTGGIAPDDMVSIDAFRLANENGTVCSVLLKWPMGTFNTWEVFDAQIKRYERNQVTKKAYRTSVFELIPYSESFVASFDAATAFPVGFGTLNEPLCAAVPE